MAGLGFIGKRIVKTTYQSPGRTAGSNEARLMFHNIHQNMRQLDAGFPRFKSGYFDINGPEVINAQYTEGFEEVPALTKALYINPRSANINNEVGGLIALGNLNGLIYSTVLSLSSGTVSPAKDINLYFYEPELVKELGIDNSGLSGGGNSVNNTVTMGDYVGLEHFPNLKSVSIVRSYLTSIKLPPQLKDFSINSPLLESFSSLPNCRALEIQNGTSLQNFEVGDDLEEFRMKENSLIDLSAKFVNKVSLRVLELGSNDLNPSNNALVLSPCFWNGSLDLTSSDFLETMIINGEGREISFSNLSHIQKYVLQNVLNLSSVDIEQMNTANLVVSVLRDIQSATSNSFDQIKTPNVEGVAHVNMMNSINTYSFDGAVKLNNLNLSSLRNIQSITNKNNLQQARFVLTDCDDYGSLDFSNCPEVSRFFIENSHLHYVTTSIKNEINSLIKCLELRLRQDTGGIGLGSLDVSDMEALVLLRLHDAGLTSLTVRPAQTYSVLHVYNNPSLSSVANWSTIRTINSLVTYGTNWDVDLSDLESLAEFRFSSVQTEIDLRGILSNTKQIVIKNDTASDNANSQLTTFHFPNQPQDIASVDIFNCSNFIQFNNLQNASLVLGNSASLRLLVINCPNFDQELPFSATFLPQRGDIRIIGCGLSQANVDATINNLYDVRSFLGANTGNVNLSGGTSATPGGVFQAPAGFVQGTSDGTPTTPQEKMYVLENNYSLIVTTN